LQKLALECLLQTKPEPLLPYKRELLLFADDEKFKDVMIEFPLASSSNKKLQPNHRAEVVRVIIKLLQAKVLKKKGSGSKKSVGTRRNIVYSFFAGL